MSLLSSDIPYGEIQLVKPTDLKLKRKSLASPKQLQFIVHLKECYSLIMFHNQTEDCRPVFTIRELQHTSLSGSMWTPKHRFGYSVSSLLGCSHIESF